MSPANCLSLKTMQRVKPRVHGSLRILLLITWLGSRSASSWSFGGRPDISSTAKCKAASKGHVWRGDSIYQQLQEFLQVSGPILQLPKELTNITTATTIMHLTNPDMQIILDPLLYLKLLPHPEGIPKLIHMTMKDKQQLAPHQILSMLSWGRFNKGYTLLLYDNDDILQYMQQYFPGFLPTFHQLKTPVEKSDAWRYHVLCGHGGIYADTDTVCAHPFDTWVNFNSTPEPGLIVGIENRFYSQEEAEEASYVHKIQVIQWTLASKRSHPVVCRMGQAIKEFIDKETFDGNRLEAEVGHDASILLRTGPGIWSTEVHSYMKQLGGQPEDVVEGGQVTDMVVLPQAAFGCNFRYWNTENKKSFVYHMYNNSWKVDHFKVADAKKQQRQQKQRQETLRLLYPLLVVLSAVSGVLAAAYAALCYMSSGLGGTKGGARRKRRFNLNMPSSYNTGLSSVVVSSSSSSPRSSPTKRGSPVARNGPGGWDRDAGIGRATASSRLQQQYRSMRRLAP